MQQKDFKSAMQKGLGRCVLACRNDPERYRYAVLWGCAHSLAYDPQCEGTRAWLLYQLICCYTDRTPFVDVLMHTLQSRRTHGWLLLQTEELLLLMANDGDETAKAALWNKYGEMLSRLRARRKPDLLDDYVFLSITLCGKTKNALRIAADMGRLLREQPAYDAEDFGQFLWHVSANRQTTALRQFAKTNADATFFLRVYDAAAEQAARPLSEEQQTRVSGYHIAHDADEDAFRLHAEQYQKEPDPGKRAKLLNAFKWDRPFPLDPEPILQDAQSENAQLRVCAWDALSLLRHPKVRAFALSHADETPSDLVPVLITNYTKDDRPLLEQLFTTIPDNAEGADTIHAIGMYIDRRRDPKFPVPAWILLRLYETDPCSFCREAIVRALGRRRLLTDELLEELTYDANDQIRAYAEKKKTLRKVRHD